MRQSSEIGKLAAALVKAQGMIEGAKKDSANPYFKSKYADLNSCWAACRQALELNGLAVIQFPYSSEEGIGVETMIVHSSGEWIMGEPFTLPLSKQDAQGGGSAITYARRYALCAALSICPEDDDGNAAADASKALRTKALAILEPEVAKGLSYLETAWNAISKDMRVACKNDIAGLKEKASRVKESNRASA